MEKNKYHVWEGEMEVQYVEDHEVTLITVVFSSILGITLFMALLFKTAFNMLLLKMKRVTKKKPSAPTAMTV